MYTKIDCLSIHSIAMSDSDDCPLPPEEPQDYTRDTAKCEAGHGLTEPCYHRGDTVQRENINAKSSVVAAAVAVVVVPCLMFVVMVVVVVAALSLLFFPLLSLLSILLPLLWYISIAVYVYILYVFQSIVLDIFKLQTLSALNNASLSTSTFIPIRTQTHHNIKYIIIRAAHARH